MRSDNKKLGLNKDVLEASQERISWVFDTFKLICVSFSGGKDSTVTLHLVAAEARRRKRSFSVLFIDWEAQYQYTIKHVENIRNLYQDVIKQFYWVALPISTPNSVSQLEPEWIAWQPGVEWVRSPPKDAIIDPDYFPFYKPCMTFEDFVPEFSSWFAGNNSAAILIGIRADESLNRFLSICSHAKLRFSDDKPWTTASLVGFYYNIYPIYDWKVEDIWGFFSKTRLPYNKLYDLMQQAGIPFRNMRVCEPFGLEQRRSLWLYHILEPETWGRICLRVKGANSGSIYANTSGNFYAKGVINKPEQHTWKSYALFLLESMPENIAEHYRNKIAIYLKWYEGRGFPEGIPDEQDNDTGSKDIPSWRRICKVLLKNDYWCRGLSFSPTKAKSYQRYLQRMKDKRKEWGNI